MYERGMNGGVAAAGVDEAASGGCAEVAADGEGLDKVAGGCGCGGAGGTGGANGGDCDAGGCDAGADGEAEAEGSPKTVEVRLAEAEGARLAAESRVREMVTALAETRAARQLLARRMAVLEAGVPADRVAWYERLALCMAPEAAGGSEGAGDEAGAIGAEMAGSTGGVKAGVVAGAGAGGAGGAADIGAMGVLGDVDDPGDAADLARFAAGLAAAMAIYPPMATPGGPVYAVGTGLVAEAVGEADEILRRARKYRR